MARVPLLNQESIVVTVAVVADQTTWTPPDGLIVGPPGGNVGDLWTGQSYQAPQRVLEPSEPDPTEELKAQIGHMGDMIKAVVNVVNSQQTALQGLMSVEIPVALKDKT